MNSQAHAPGWPRDHGTRGHSPHERPIAMTTPKWRPIIAALATVMMVVQPSTTLLITAAQQTQTPKPATAPPGGQQPQTTKPATPPPAGQQPPATPGAKPTLAATAASTTPPPIDGGWPRFYNLPSGGSLLMYQPQISTWEKQAHVVAFSAVSYRPKTTDNPSEKPTVGTVKLEADTKVAVEDRLVRLSNMKIAEANFQTLPKEQVREIAAEIDKAVPDDERVIALDRVLANLDKSQIVVKNVEGIKADPP